MQYQVKRVRVECLNYVSARKTDTVPISTPNCKRSNNCQHLQKQVNRTMSNYYSFIGFIVAAAFATSVVDADAPAFCHGLDCPAYTVVAEKTGYEVRLYNASKWVATTVLSNKWDIAGDAGFELLFDYISGQNSASEKVPMTAPVAIQVLPGSEPSNFTVHFFVPYAYQANTPTPTNPKVFLTDLPKLTAYVYQYGGIATDDSTAKYAAEMESYLKRDKVNYVPGVYLTGTYDPPYRIIGRHNEIWFLAA